MSVEDKNSESESESNVWASYSDLFTNVAIIFLVMFVFALIKATISQVKTVQTKIEHEKELNGKLTKRDIEKSKKRIEKVQKTVTEMREYEDIIDQKVLELNTYAKKLQENKKVLQDIIISQEKQNSLIHSAEERLAKKQKEVEMKEKHLVESQKRIEQLNDELVRIQNDATFREESLRRSIASEEEKVESQSSKIKKIKMEMINKQKNLEARIAQLTEQVSNSRKESKELMNDLVQEKKYQESKDNVISDLKAQLSSIEDNLIKNKNSSNVLAQEKQILHSKLQDMSGQHEALAKKLESLEAQLNASQLSNRDLQSKMAEFESKSSQAEKSSGKWKEEFEKQLKEAGRLKTELQNSNLKFRQLADTMSKLKDSVKNGVAMKLRDKFKENNLDAKVDLKTGEVVLLSGEGFNFEKGSSRLSKEAKIILKKIIPIYSEVLLGDEKVYQQITSISMEGHSSPSFGGRYVPPTEKNSKAYSFNMRLSAMRASSVANFLMGNEIGEYPHKDKMKFLLQSVGMAYMKPIPLEKLSRLPASVVKEDQCGPWDCFKSQRVQMNFLLKDNMEEIKKIIDSNGVIR